MKNLLASWFRSLTAFENGPVKQEFSIVDPTAAPANGGLNTVVLAVSPSDGTSPTIVSLYFDGSGVKLFEKKYQNDADAQTEMSAIATDLNEAASLSKEGKIEQAKKLAESLFEKYKRSSDPLVNEQPTTTMTQAALEPTQYKGWAIHKAEDGRWMAEYDVMALYADSIDTLRAKIDNKVRQAMGRKLKAGITMQNLFFDSVDEAMDFQEKMKTLQGPEGSEEGKPLWEQMGNGEQVAPSNETPAAEDNELAPPSLSFDRIEKDKAKHDKDIGKRIKEQVKTEVESALEQKSASVFGPDQEELVEALRKNGRNWDEIKKIFTKELSYNEDDTTVFLDSIRQKEEGGPVEGLPMAPKPPEDLVSPETHDKLVKEIEDKSEPKSEPLPLADEIARADNDEIRKVADRLCGVCRDEIVKPGRDECDKCRQASEDEEKSNKAASKKVALNPLQEPPAVGQNPGQPLSAPVEEAPTFDSPTPAAPEATPEPEFLEAPKSGDRVYVMGDYEVGDDGFEGTMLSEFTSKGDKYAVISKDDGENAEVALHRVVKASQKKVAQVYYEKKAVGWQPKTGEPCSCRPGIARDNCPSCEGTGQKIDFKRIREKTAANEDRWTNLVYECPSCETQFTESKKPMSACPICRAPADKIKLIKEAAYPGGKCAGCGKDVPTVWGQTVCKECVDKGFSPEHKEADLEVEGKANEDVIRMFIDDSFPKDKMPVWGTTNLKITKYPNGWALVNYQTPILYRANGSDVVVFNTDKYSPTTSRIQSAIRGMFSGQSVKEVTEGGIHAVIDQSEPFKDLEVNPEASLEKEALWKDKLQNVYDDFKEFLAYDRTYSLHERLGFSSAEEAWETNPMVQGSTVPEDYRVVTDLESLHESALKLQAELEREGEIAIYFHKEGIEKKASDDSAFEGNGWCRVWIQDDEISSDAKYPAILKLPDENQRIAALKDLARDLAYQALREADHSAAKVGVQAWFDALTPSDHNRIDWVALASPESEEIESSQEPKIEKKADEPAPKEVPTQFKQLERAPAKTQRELAQPATEEQAKLVQDMQSSLSSLEAIKSMVAQAKAKLNEEIKNIEQQGGRVQLEAELKQKMERLSKLVETAENQMIYAGETVVRLIQENKEKPFKPSDAWKVQKLVEKFAGAQEYLDKAIAGAQSLATTEQVRDLVFFPRKVSKLHKSAGFMETLDQVYDSVLEALKLVIGSEEEQPAAV